MINGQYDAWRDSVQDGTVVFFHRYGFHHVLRDPHEWLGWLSNTGISWAQYPGSETRHWHNFIHVEVLYWAERWGRHRLMSAGFSGEKPVGYKERYASERIKGYKAPVLSLPLLPSLQKCFIQERAADFIDTVVGVPYATTDLAKAVLPIWLTPTQRHAWICSSFVYAFLMAAGVEDSMALAWNPCTQQATQQPARPQSQNPMELIMRPRLWGTPTVLCPVKE